MQKTPRPAKATVDTQWYKDHLDRIQDYAKDAICAVATDLGPNGGLRLSTDDAVAYATNAIRVFNQHAERLDRLYGFPTRLKLASTGWIPPRSPQDVTAARPLNAIISQPGVAFTVATKRPAWRSYRLRGGRPAFINQGSAKWLRKCLTEAECLEALGGRDGNRVECRWVAEPITFPRAARKARDHSISKLLWLSSDPKYREPVIDWMLDFLTMMMLPQIEKHEGETRFHRGHWWFSRGRKGKKGKRFLKNSAQLDQRIRLARSGQKEYRPSLVRAHSKLESQIRNQPVADNCAIALGFDLLMHNGDDLRRRRLVERKAALSKLMLRSRGGIQYVEHAEGHGDKMFAAVCDLGLEGIVSKRLDAPYRSGPSKSWIKVKNPKSPAATRALDGTF